MQTIAEESASDVAVVGVFCNQFGHQTNEDNDEILNTLEHVRPGNGFKFSGDLFAKVNVNGSAAHPLFEWMRSTIKTPQDPEGGDSALILPRGGFDGTCVNTWAPVNRNDIAWNFEKFLFNKEGVLVNRYSRFYPTADIAKDIEALRKQ